MLFCSVMGNVGTVPSAKSLVGSTRELGVNDGQYPRPFHIWTSHQIHEKLLAWQEEYPNLVRVVSAQDEYGLPRSGGSRDCPFDEGGDGCLHYVMTIQDFVAHPEGSESSNHLPELLWSGALHGNERVGPTAVMEAAALLLEAATCESKPYKPHQQKHKEESFQEELQDAKTCRNALIQRGISDKHRQWLARLVTTRRLVVVPTANALGYFRNQRTEERIDPNRDFPYDVLDPTQCMQTIAGRTFNEVFRQHMFQLSLTFHGGTEVIAYEWGKQTLTTNTMNPFRVLQNVRRLFLCFVVAGAPTYLGKLSPDDTAQAEIAKAYSRFAGSFGSTKKYDVGTMNDKVYYVRGGMEDWAYAGSWDPDRVIECAPKTYDPYPAHKTVYNNSTLRVYNILVEASHQKIPSQSKLGTSENVLDMNTNGNGHISRNIRLSLSAHDLVEPYVAIVGVNDLALSDDIIPLTNRSCNTIKTVMIPKNVPRVEIEFTVGGALTINQTQLWFAKSSDVPDGTMDCLMQPSLEAIQAAFTLAEPIGDATGTGFLSETGSQPHPSVTKTDTEPSLGPLFRASLSLPKMGKGDSITVIASARVDQGWTTLPTASFGPNVPPQAHIVNARTNPDWNHESEGKFVKGRLDWFSIPIKIVVGDYKDSVGSQAGKEISTIEVSNRFGRTTGQAQGGIAPSKPREEKPTVGWKAMAVLGSGCAALVLAIAMVLMRRRNDRMAHRAMVQAYDANGTSAAFEGDMEMTDYAEDEEFSDEDDEAGTLT